MTHAAIHGSTHWLEPDARTRLQMGQTANLSVTTPKKGKTRMRTQVYEVKALLADGSIVAYRLSYDTDGETIRYTVTLGSGAGVERVLTCNCFDSQYRVRDGDGPGSQCRHAQAMRASLLAIGLL